VAVRCGGGYVAKALARSLNRDSGSDGVDVSKHLDVSASLGGGPFAGQVLAVAAEWTGVERANSTRAVTI
jgi:hypothetical protein